MTPDGQAVVVVQWPSFGPYHVARLRACQEAAPPGVEVVGLATAGTVEGRPWASESDRHDVRIVVGFPDRVYNRIPAREAARRVRVLLDEVRPVAVGVSGYGMADSRAALRWCRRHGAVPVLLTETKADDAPRRFWKEWVKRWYVSRFTAALCGGTPHRRYLVELGMPPERIFDKYDVVDNAAFAAAADAVRAGPAGYAQLPGLGDGRPFFLASSRFIERKNLRRLLEAHLRYRRMQPAGWRMVVLGTGAGEAALKQQVADSTIPDVTFAGFHQTANLVAYYPLAGAFVHPALQEQWGLVVNEAMACGLPVLVSRTVGAAHDLVRDGDNGFTFDPLDVEQLAQLMLKVSASDFPLSAFGDASRRIISDWTPEHFGRNFWAAVGAATSGGQPPPATPA